MTREAVSSTTASLPCTSVDKRQRGRPLGGAAVSRTDVGHVGFLPIPAVLEVFHPELA